MKDIIRMNQLAGVITEGQAKKMMQILNEETSAREAKLLTNVYYIEEFRDLAQHGLEDELGYHAGGAVAASEVDPDVLAQAERAGVAFLYIRKGTVGMYEDGTFEDEEGNTAGVEEKDLKFLD